MFSTLPMSPPLPPHRVHTHTTYTPPRPSPLSSSPIRASHHAPRQTLSSPIQPSTSHLRSNTNTFIRRASTPQTLPFSRRPIKNNPLIHKESKEQSRETRRKLFLKRVREDSEDKRWKNRGGDDELLRAIWVAEERRRLEGKEREGDLEFDEDEEREGDFLGSSLRSVDEEMADEVAQKEEEEIEAMLDMIPIPHQDMSLDTEMETDTPYGSDDEEFDGLLLDAIQAVENQHQRMSHQGEEGADDRMDES